MEARRTAIDWKNATHTLPDAARAPGSYRSKGPYAFCLPAEFASLNLLPEARDIALQRFHAAKVSWQTGCDGGPSNHLLSSQVQCANALAPFVGYPGALKAIFRDVLPIEDVLPFGAVGDGTAMVSAFDATDHVVFEWQGLANHFNEWAKSPTRGSNATSVDASIRYRTPEGLIELALIEWKFTESYGGSPLSGGAASAQTRQDRYRPLFDRPGGPMLDVVPLDAFFVEPYYQLMRLALLAFSIEEHRELDADVVRVVIAAPAPNTGYWNSPAGRAIGQLDGPGTVELRFPTLLRNPDRFVVYDTSSLVEATAPTSDEFKRRYSVLAAPSSSGAG
jgi:Restriction Endonuclease associating with ARP